MYCETLSIGSELVAGGGIDTNVATIARRLAGLGVDVARHTILPDDLDPLVAHLRAFRERAERPALLIVTGGLGPTRDDITRDAVALAMDAPLAEDAPSRQAIEQMFAGRGWRLTENNLRQALMPAGADVLANPRGTAPGFHAHSDGVHVVCMPGVPAEMVGMFDEQVVPLVRKLAGGGTVVAERIVHTFGSGESHVGQMIADHMTPDRNPRLGTTVADGLVSIRLRASAPTAEAARRLLDDETAALRQRVGDLYVGCDGERLAEVVARLLTERGATLAVAESCTGGLIAKMLTDVPGASAFLIEGLVTYANRSKVARLGVPTELIDRHGAVSEPVARAMAEGLRREAEVTYALGTTGIAGPEGGTADKPVGLVWVALAGPDGTRAIRPVLPGDRRRIRNRGALAALNLLRLELQGRTGA